MPEETVKVVRNSREVEVVLPKGGSSTAPPQRQATSGGKSAAPSPSLTDPSYRPNCLGSNAGPAIDLAAIRPDLRYPHKCGAVFEPEGRRHECVSSATHAGIMQHQHEHQAERIRVLTARVAELEVENAKLRDEKLMLQLPDW